MHAGRKSIPAGVAAQLAEHLGDETLTDARDRRAVARRRRQPQPRHRRAPVISEETVKVHMKHIMEKLGASDRTEAVAIALRRGIIEL